MLTTPVSLLDNARFSPFYLNLFLHIDPRFLLLLVFVIQSHSAAMSWVNMEVIQKVTPWLQDTSESSDSLSDPPPPPAPIVMSLAPQRLRWPAPGKMAWVQHYGPRKNFNTLFRGEVAYYVFTDRYVRHDHPGADDITYNTTVFKDEPTGLALYGLYGCTAIVVLSKNGAWISHRK